MKVCKTNETKITLPQIEPKHQKAEVNPAELLNALKAKQQLYAQLKNEGLIHKDRHLHLEKELRQTIQDLEELIPQLEVA